MSELEKRIHDKSNGLEYVLCGDYYIPNIRLSNDERPIGRWGRMHREYLKETNLLLYSELLLEGKLWSYLADLNEQAQERMEYIIAQMMEAEGVTEELKRCDQMEWVRLCNSIRSRAEEIVQHDLIFA